MWDRIWNTFGLIVLGFLLGLYAAKQFKYGGTVPLQSWIIAIVFLMFVSVRNIFGREN